MKSFKVVITFDGTAYHGWQRQKNGITVQERIENALEKIFGTPITVTGCSRTDAGVHAHNFVFNFSAETQIPAEKLPHALNYHLDRDISALSAVEVDDSFNARFSAKGKKYVYRIWNGRIRDPFADKYSWHIPYHLDIDKMKAAAVCFEGTHDFAGFMATGGDQKTTVRTVTECSVRQNPDCKEDIRITVSADAFLYNMARIITGTLLDVGLNKTEPEDIPRIIESKDRTLGGMTAPPQGLFLEEIFYESEVCKIG